MKKFISFFIATTMLLTSMVGNITVANAAEPITIYVAGDSTAKDYEASDPSRGEGGWAEFLGNYFSSEVVVDDRAEGGRSSRAFINEGRLDKIANSIKPGDYLMIQFGHNDASHSEANRYTPLGTPDANGSFPYEEGVRDPNQSNWYTSASGTYKWFMKQYIDLAKEKGATPILLTPVSRMYFNSDGTIKPHHYDATQTGYTTSDTYVEAVKQLAEEQNVLLIDAFSITKNMYETWGETESTKIQFVKTNGQTDKTHYNKFGGFYVGGLIAQEIKKLGIDISNYVVKPTETRTLDKADVFLVGDSTVCEYGVDAGYSDKRNGWGMQIGNFLDSEKVTVKNLAISGRSSRSFITEANYQTLLNEIGVGDYLFIGFGHNDAKTDTRYTDPQKPITDETSTKYYLYNYYIKPALEKGATPILTSPIVRLRFTAFDDTGMIRDSHGFYDDCIKELAQELNIDFVDNTQLTTDLYNELKYDGAKLLHAVYIEGGIDGTHLNSKGAYKVAEMVAQSVKESNCSLKQFIVEPPVQSDVLYGDVNEDGIVAASDASVVLQYVLSPEGVTLSENGLKAADVYGEGTVLAKSAAAILTKALNSDYVFPVQG